ncbi:CBS domain-containing protein [Siccirubricoccus sp. KC 17139]|uniref:CBS domain-containing protein n=1 Tax=Siccirubricoccus soli TaxID=2899147 RepID=A0ABT1D133_9PROT|nr:CBS domain-containing protein [Siccirubricoccus soli]MCO6415367.1 CBS domain-containing protein [Siccirubricoccus soli]MCP2681499.1 CBS domain-containing protein [Siccirubricoccus soli]
MTLQLTARDLMTPDVVSVPPETAVVAVARLLAERGISAVPVLDQAGTVLGIVTEADLIRRLAGQEDAKPGWLRSLFADPAAMADRYARTHGATAADVMTREVVTVGEAATAARIAHLMEDRGIRRVLVVTEGRLRGIVSRADLLRAVVAAPKEETTLDDDRIRRAVLAAMRKEPWADSFYTLVEVKDGVVEFHGFMRDAAAKRALKVLAEQVPGVKGVVDKTEPLPVYLYGV